VENSFFTFICGGKKGAVGSRDAPDTVFAGYPAYQKPDTGYPAGYAVRAGYRISGRILGLTTIFLVKYQIKL
jgi:hypothetical protein